MISNQISQQNLDQVQQKAINKSLISLFVSFAILFLIRPETQFSLGINIWISIGIALLSFFIFDDTEHNLRVKTPYKNFYPPEYNFYKIFLLITFSVYTLLILLSRNDIFNIFAILLIALLASLISIFPYLKTQLKNQESELDDQKKQITDLSQKFDDVFLSISEGKPVQLAQSPRYDSKTGKILFDLKNERIQKVLLTNLEKPQPRYDSKTGKPLFKVDEERMKDSIISKESKIIPENVELISKEKNISLPITETKEIPAQRIQGEIQPQKFRTNQISASFNKKMSKNISENFSGYLFFGAIIFLFIAVLAWIAIFFPSSSNITIGSQTWIAGDSVVFFGVLIILLSEFVIGNSKYSDYIPINYLGIGIGLGIGIIGLMSIRFEVLSVFLSEKGLISKDWLFILLSFLIACLSWIYAWRSPYRDLIFGTLLSGFILVDYYLESQFNQIAIIGLMTGIIFIFIPGIHASLVENQDNRFLLGGFVVYDLLFLISNNSLALITLNPIIYSLGIIFPVFVFIVIFGLKKINQTYLYLCLPTSSFMLIINEMAFINNYISTEIFEFVFIGILLLFLIPKVIYRNNNNYTILLISLNAFMVITHSLLNSLQLFTTNNWFIILVPVTINILLIMYEVNRNIIKIEYLTVLYGLTILLFGLFLKTTGAILLLLGIIGIFSILTILKKVQPTYILTLLSFGLIIIVLGSFFGYLDQWELICIPLLIPIVIISVYLSRSTSKMVILPAITVTLLSLVFLTFSQSFFALYFLIEYFAVLCLLGCYFIIKRYKQDNDLYFWFVLYIGLPTTTLYAEYDSLIIYTMFLVVSIQSFIIVVIYLAEFAEKRFKQNIYDISITAIFGGLFALVILEQFDNEYFIVLFALFLLLNMFMVWYLLRYSGMDFTMGIIIPSLVIIGKELFVTQYLALNINPVYSLVEFILVAVYSFCLALLSRRITEYESLISPTISAMFSIELVLIILFINKIIVNIEAIGTFFILLTIIILVNLLQKVQMYHIEHGLIVLSTLILAIVLPITESFARDYILGIIIVLPIFWLILRFKIKKVFFLIDGIELLGLSICEYTLSLTLPNTIFIQSGLLAQQIIIAVGLTSLVFGSRINSIQDRFKTILALQFPFWLSLLLFFDLDTNAKIFYSSFTMSRPLENLFVLKITLLILLIFMNVLYILNKFEFNEKTANKIIIGVISNFTLGLLIVQLIISQVISDPTLNGLILVLLILLIQIISLFFIKRQSQIQMNNQTMFVANFYNLVTFILFLLGNGLLSGLLALLGTELILLGFQKNIRKELQIVGGFYILFSISNIAFDVINNFNSMILEIAISSSILAICLLLLGMVINYKIINRVYTNGHQIEDKE